MGVQGHVHDHVAVTVNVDRDRANVDHAQKNDVKVAERIKVEMAALADTEDLLNNHK